MVDAHGMTFAELILRVDDVRATLVGAEQEDARRVVEICRELTTRERSRGLLVSSERDAALKRELAGLVEVLARRSTNAIVAATLGRAALADLARSQSGFDAACRECDEKLRLLGL